MALHGGPGGDEEGGGGRAHYASNIPPQNMSKADLKEAREAYQEEVRRMRQLFLSRISDEASTSPARASKQ